MIDTKNKEPCEHAGSPSSVYPLILVLYEKHGRTSFHVPNESSLFETALAVLTERNKNSLWNTKPKVPHAQDLLPFSVMLELAEQDLAQYDAIQEAIVSKDGKEAFRILIQRSDSGHEYERMDLESYCTQYRSPRISDATQALNAIRRQAAQMRPVACCVPKTMVAGGVTSEVCDEDCAWQMLDILIADAMVEVELADEKREE